MTGTCVATLSLGLIALAGCQSMSAPPVDPQAALIARGREIFLKETFNGNGRTCATCHPPENNFTIDPAFIATLPPRDPLFVAEFNPDLKRNVENPRLMREFGLIMENLDGFDDLEHKFVMRGVPRKALMSAAVMGALVLGGTLPAHTQEATEMFIPIGQSPGLSGKVTVIGTIEAVNAGTRTVTLAGPSGPSSAEITNRTDVWLDRSTLRLPNQKGSFADCRKGRLAEVKYENGTRRARWIKVQLTDK